MPSKRRGPAERRRESPRGASPAKPRRTQAERREQTRSRIILAAIASLEKHGYQGTSITAVCKLAGVSRGAFSHHFPAKSDMCIAAMGEALARRADIIYRTAETLPAGPARERRLLGLIYQHQTSGLFYAWLELGIAARTDPDLRRKATEFATRYEAALRPAFGTLSRRDEDPRLEWLPQLVSAVIDGLGFHAIFHRSRERPERVLDLASELIEGHRITKAR